MTELYKALYDFETDEEDELALKRGETVKIIKKDGIDWWLAERQQNSKESGLVPSNFLEKEGVKHGGGSIGSIIANGFKRHSTNKSGSNDTAPTIPIRPHKYKKAIVVHDYAPENSDEIKLMRGEYVTVMDKMEDDGWWKGRNETGSTGLFPSNFVEIIENQNPPSRPARTRPPTVSKSTDSVTRLSPPSSPPPPVPVNTRPNTLLTKPKASLSLNLPKGHQRLPSIPLLSPDLPPISPIHPRPLSSNEHSTKTNQEALQNMAKPPKIPVKPNIEPSSPSKTTVKSNVDPVATPPRTPIKSTIDPVAPPRSPSTINNSPKRSTPLVPTNEDTKIQQLVQLELDKIRKEFQAKLEIERNERLKLQAELDDLKKTI